MTDKEFDQAFGGSGTGQTTFTSRLGRSDAPEQNGHAEEETVGSGPYKPYGFLPSGNIGETCDVQRWVDGTDIAEGTEFQYRFLLRIEYVGSEEIRLFLPDCIIVIEGKNLRELRRKLARRQVTFICQYSPRIWPAVRQENDTMIERIHVVSPAGQ